MRILSLLLAALILLPPPAAAQLDLSLPDMGNPADQALSPADEARIGERMMREIRRELDLVEDPAVAAYVRDLGRRLAGSSSAPAGDYHFFVLDDPRINAFAMPGGYIGLHSGLITAARTESELASVVAHELAHVTQRHLARRLAASQGSSLRTAALILAGLLLSTQNPQAGAAAATSGMASGIESQLAYSRDHEREADRIGLRMLADAGLDPEGMPAFFETLLDSGRYRTAPPAFLSTHPLTEARIADARAMARDMAVDDAFESPGFGLMRARLQALQATDPAEVAERFRARIEGGQDGRDSHYGLAIARIRMNESAAATDLLARLIEEDGEYAAYYLGLAEAANAAGDTERALKVLDEGLSLFPEDPALAHRRVEMLLAAERPGQALALASRLTRNDPSAPELWRLRARAASAADDEAESALSMAQYYAVQGDLQAGLAQLERVSGAGASGAQQARASALRERWEAELSPPG